jgi:hypothetical protein
LSEQEDNVVAIRPSPEHLARFLMVYLIGSGAACLRGTQKMLGKTLLGVAEEFAKELKPEALLDMWEESTRSTREELCEEIEEIRERYAKKRRT